MATAGGIWVAAGVQVLDADKGSPLYGRVQTADAIKDATRCISLTALFNAIEKTGFHIAKEKKDAVLEYGPLWQGGNDATLGRTVYVLKHWLGEIKRHCESWWDLGAAEGGGLTMNDGITSCINVLRSVVGHLEQKGTKLLHLEQDDLVQVITPYARALGAYLGRMSTEERKAFRDLRGIQGQNARTRHAQAAMRHEFHDFNPAGLDEFLKLEKEQTNLKAKEVIDRIERMLQQIVVDTLKVEFGEMESEWWTLGVPKKVRLETSQRSENDDARRGTKEAYFELMDYRRIALEHWELFAGLFGYGSSGNKEKKTKWMVTVNDKRNIVSHPSSGVSLKHEELSELQDYERFLRQRSTGRNADTAETVDSLGELDREEETQT